MIATTPEQSQRLLACGVSPDTADMCWTTWENDGEKITQLNVHDEYCYEVQCLNPIPAWSLSALLGLLPKKIDIDGYPYRISIYFESPDEPVIGNQWCLYYKPVKHTEKSHRIDDVAMYADNLIECAVSMAIWLINMLSLIHI